MMVNQHILSDSVCILENEVDKCYLQIYLKESRYQEKKARKKKNHIKEKQ